jgi:hypothetical protein
MFDVFVSSPYSDDNEDVVEERVKIAQRYVAHLASDRIFAFSVIAYIHPILVENSLPTDYEFWRDMCISSITACDVVHVLCVDGWDTSVGVADEIEVARSLGKRIVYKTEVT